MRLTKWHERMVRMIVCTLPNWVGVVALRRLVWRAVKLNCVADSVGLLGAGGVIWLRAGRYLILLATLAPPSP